MSLSSQGQTMRLTRLLQHLWVGPRQAARLFPKRVLERITRAIAVSESRHSGEIRFVVESSLPLPDVFKGVSARERAVEVFSDLRVWDTETNSGILVYLLLADHDVEIIADRGIHAKVGSEGWQVIVSQMETAFRAGHFEAGIVAGVEALGQLLTAHFPAASGNANELPDQPVVM
jgi:uncharacterized membrane protein